MGHLLKRGYLVQVLKIANRMLRRTPSQNKPFVGSSLQEFTFIPACLFYKHNTSLQYSTTKPRCLLQYSKSEPVCHLSNKFGRSFVLGSVGLKQIHWSSALFIENYDSHVEEKCLKSYNTENGLKAQVGNFMDKLQNCTSVDEVLSLSEMAIQTNCLHVECLSVLFSAFQENVYKTFSFSWNLSKPHLKRTQLVWNFLTDCTIEPYTTDPRFLNLISHVENLVDDIPFEDCIQILYNLFYLFIDITNSKLACKISDRCSGNLDNYNLNQLAKFATSLPKCPHDDVLFGRIADAAKMVLMSHSSHSLELIDLCVLFQNIKVCLNEEMIELGTDLIINKLKSDPSSVSLEMLSQINWFSRIANHDCDERLINYFLELPPQCLNFDITNNSLTFDVCMGLGSTHWLCPVLQKLTEHCILELTKEEPMSSIHDFVIYSLPLLQPSTSILENKMKLFIQLVEESDNFLLCEMMLLYSRIDRSEAVRRKDLAWAYHQRLVRLFASLNLDQQETLLWRNNGFMAKYLLETVITMKRSHIQIKKDLLAAIDNHFTLKPTESNPPVFKIVIATRITLDRLRSNIITAPPDFSTLTKLIMQLDFIYLMKFYKEFDSLCYMPFLSPNARQQCLKMRQSLWEVFQDRLSSTDRLVSSFTSNKIVPLQKKHMNGKLAGGDIFVELLNSLPRFLQDDKSHLRALKILDMSIETIPMYQREMFESLTSFVTSSPKLLIYSGIQLMKILAYTGHQPEHFEIFTSWSHQLATSVMEHGWLDKSILVQLTYYLSLLGIFHDEVLLKVFSLDFLMALEQELETTTIQVPLKVKQDLALLNRSVAIECPHLTVPWFCKSLLPTDTTSDKADKVSESVSRLTGDPDYIMKFTESPYAHNIDALIYFDPSSGIVKTGDIAHRHSLLDIERIALLCLLPSHFCHESDIMTGKCQANIRQLQILGYTVVVFTPRELSSMELQTEDSLDNYVRTKINDSMHAEVLGDFHQ